MTKVLKNIIGGEWVDAQTTNRQPVLNPATAETLAEVPISTEKDVDQAVKTAREMFEEWRRVPAPKRARIMFRFHDLLTKNHKGLAELITKENGKTFEDAYGEVQRGIECVEFAAGIPHLLKGEILPDIAEGIESAMFRYPVGVVGGITPFNFPMMVPCWMFPLAIACGNTFVLKPSEQTPLLAERLAELITEAGLRKGVLNIVHGAHDVVNRLLSHPDVDAISFVGSQPVAENVYRTAASYGKRVQALAGAKNHAIVLADANMDLTVKGIMNASFGSAGQRCMATSVVVAVEEIADELIDNLMAAANQIILGNGLDPDVKLGPVISDKHLEHVHGYIESGIAEGANLIRDGRKDSEGTKGFFLGPTIFDEVKPTMKIWKEEIFAPVLSIVRVKDLDEAIELTNKSDFGNGSVIYTNSGSAVRKYRENIEVGMLGVNINVPAPMAFFPFSGWKNSFYGDLHANGRDGVEFYTRRKMITTRWFG